MEMEIKNLFKALKDREVNIKIIINDLVMGVETLLNIIIITL